MGNDKGRCMEGVSCEGERDKGGKRRLEEGEENGVSEHKKGGGKMKVDERRSLVCFFHSDTSVCD